MPRPDEQFPTPPSPSGTTSWHPVAPGLGLALGAGPGLIAGAVARARVGGDDTATQP